MNSNIKCYFNYILQGGPVLNVNNSPFESPSKNKLTYIVIFLKNASQGKYSPYMFSLKNRFLVITVRPLEQF